MRSLCALLGVGVIVGLLPSPASATSLTLQYDLTVTQRCEPSTGICSSVNIGGLPLTLTTDLTISRREIYPEASWAWFGPTTVTFDTSVLGDFPNPFTPDAVFTDHSNFMVNHDFGVGNWGHTFVSAVDPRVEYTYDTGQMYMVQRTLEFGRDVVANGIPEDPTSADIAMLLANNMSYQEIVYAMRCSAGGQDCVFDPRSYSASGTATFRGALTPVPEPASGVLFGLALAAYTAARRLTGAARRISACPPEVPVECRD
jgi:hypothetical protein